VVAIPDQIVQLLKWPFDLLHDQLCPCRQFNCTERSAEFETHPYAGPYIERDTP
jgi:hypothetical protein